MAKASVKAPVGNFYRNGTEIKEYPKLIPNGDVTKDEKGRNIASKILVNSKEEEDEIVAKLQPVEDDKKKPAGWGK